MDTAEEPAYGARHGEKGINGLAKLGDGKRVKVVLIEPHVVAEEYLGVLRALAGPQRF